MPNTDQPSKIGQVRYEKRQNTIRSRCLSSNFLNTTRGGGDIERERESVCVCVRHEGKTVVTKLENTLSTNEWKGDMRKGEQTILWPNILPFTDEFFPNDRQIHTGRGMDSANLSLTQNKTQKAPATTNGIQLQSTVQTVAASMITRPMITLKEECTRSYWDTSAQIYDWDEETNRK